MKNIQLPKWLLYSLVPPLFLITAIAFLLTTESGFRLLLTACDSVAGPVFSVERIEGRILDSWRLENVQIHIEDIVDVALDELSCSWKPGALVAKDLRIDRISVQGLVLRLPDSGEKQIGNSPVVLPDIHFPMNLDVQDLQVQGAELYFSGSSEPFVVNELALKAAGHDDQVAIERLMVDTPDYGGDLRGKVQLSGTWPLAMSGDWRVTDPGIGDLSGLVKTEGDLETLSVDIGFKTPAVAMVQGQLSEILNDLHWKAKGETEHFQLGDIQVDLPVDGTLNVIEASGTMETYGGILSADIHYQGYPQVQARAEVQGDYSGLNIHSLRVFLDESKLSTRGRISWADGFSWQAEFEGEQLDPALFASQWPGKIDALLHSRGKWSAEKLKADVEIDHLQGELRGSPITGSGRAGIDGKTVNVDALHLQSGPTYFQVNGRANSELDLTFQAGSDDLASLLPESSGVFQLQGTLRGSRQHPHLSMTMDGSGLKVRDFMLQGLKGEVSADLAGEGTIDADMDDPGIHVSGLNIHFLRVFLDESKLSTRGRISWADGFSWQVELEGEQLDPALFASQWPGKIDAILHSQGKRSAEKLMADVEIDHLQGELRGFSISGSGRAGIDGKTVNVDALQLQSGSTHFQVHGRANNELDLTFQAGSDDLASLLPESSGVFQLQGTLRGSRQHPHLSMNMDGSDLKVQDFMLQGLKGEVSADLAADGNIDVNMDVAGIHVQGETISKARLQMKGTPEQHNVDLSLESELGDLQLTVAGGLQQRFWQGELAEFLLQTGQFGDWQIEQPVNLLLAEKEGEFSGFSLVQDQVRLSLAGKWQQAEGWQVEGDIDDLSLQLLKEWSLVATQLDGVLTASFEGRGHGATPDQAEIVASVPDFSLTAEDEDEEIRTWHWTDNNFQATLEDNMARVTAQTLFQDGSKADLEVRVGNCCDFNNPEDMSLDGNLGLNIKDLSPLAPLSGYMVQGKGQFEGNYALKGTVESPILQGKMVLVDGEIRIPDAGVAVQELELSFAGDTTATKMELNLVSGSGSLKAKGQVKQNRQKQWLADFTIQGNDFTAVDLAEYTANISPDLHLVYGLDGTALNGTVTVTKARIAPVGFHGSVSSSRDVVIVDANGQQEKQTLPLSLDLTVVMGKEVKVDAFGVKGFLDGKLEINQNPGQEMTGLGNLALRDGTFVFKSVDLKINRGRVFYQGGPIDDPGLDVQANKEVDDKEVGVRLTGSVSHMEMNLFSNPFMDESDILAYLLSGHGMSSSNETESSMLSAAAASLGIGKGESLLKDITEGTGLDVSLAGGAKATDVNLVVGKEIYKDLYISFDKGLTDSTGAFKARYDLKYGFSVETETTSEATGSDLFWSLER